MFVVFESERARSTSCKRRENSKLLSTRVRDEVLKDDDRMMDKNDEWACCEWVSRVTQNLVIVDWST